MQPRLRVRKRSYFGLKCELCKVHDISDILYVHPRSYVAYFENNLLWIANGTGTLVLS